MMSEVRVWQDVGMAGIDYRTKSPTYNSQNISPSVSTHNIELRRLISFQSVSNYCKSQLCSLHYEYSNALSIIIGEWKTHAIYLKSVAQLKYIWEIYCQTWFQTSVWVYLPEELSESWKFVVGRTIRNTFLKHEIQNVST